MKSDFDMLRVIASGEYKSLISDISTENANLIRNKIKDIPESFFEPKFSSGEENDSKISIIEFAMRTVGFNVETKNALMDRYHIDPYDIQKLQKIVDDIRVVKEYSTFEEKQKQLKNNSNKKSTYGIALAEESKLNMAYPLWLAYIYMNSENPFIDIKNRLKDDHMDDKYTPEYIMGIIEHTNSLMFGKNENERKDFFVSAINEILDREDEKNLNKKINMEI